MRTALSTGRLHSSDHSEVVWAAYDHIFLAFTSEEEALNASPQHHQTPLTNVVILRDVSWGETLTNFVKCLRQFLNRRSLLVNSALNQNMKLFVCSASGPEKLYKLRETPSLTNSSLFGRSCKCSKCSTGASFCLCVKNIESVRPSDGRVWEAWSEPSTCDWITQDWS